MHGGGSLGGSHKGRLFKLDFPLAKFWVKISWGGWVSEPKDPPPPSYRQNLLRSASRLDAPDDA